MRRGLREKNHWELTSLRPIRLVNRSVGLQRECESLIVHRGCLAVPGGSRERGRVATSGGVFVERRPYKNGLETLDRLQARRRGKQKPVMSTNQPAGSDCLPGALACLMKTHGSFALTRLVILLTGSFGRLVASAV